jgi:hypothetical protein
MRAVWEIGEAIVGRDAVAIETKEPSACLAQKSEVLVLGVFADNGALVDPDCLCRVTVGSEQPAVVRPIVAQPTAQLDPQQARSGRHSPPSRRRHDCLGHRHIGPDLVPPLTFRHHATALALA